MWCLCNCTVIQEVPGTVPVFYVLLVKTQFMHQSTGYLQSIFIHINVVWKLSMNMWVQYYLAR